MTDTATNNSTAEQGKQAAGDVAGSAKNEARSVAQDAKNQAADVLGTARSELRNQAADQAKTLSATLGDIGRQLGDMADNSNEPEAQVAQLTRSAADTLSQRAERIDREGIDGVVDDVKRFARNRPGAFLLGSVAAGFAIGRLAKHADLKHSAEQAKGEIDTDRLEPEAASDDADSDDSAATTPLPAPAAGRPVAGGVTS
ncbi:MAG: hypothetical protein WA964_11785 [Ilumatobacter sp.]|uniref:hypothetical protein n=1 Tax=Ilumatobacter sp. TaxID=1967498 RepID=UPI003C78D27D